MMSTFHIIITFVIFWLNDSFPFNAWCFWKEMQWNKWRLLLKVLLYMDFSPLQILASCITVVFVCCLMRTREFLNSFPLKKCLFRDCQDLKLVRHWKKAVRYIYEVKFVETFDKRRHCLCMSFLSFPSVLGKVLFLA